MFLLNLIIHLYNQKSRNFILQAQQHEGEKRCALCGCDAGAPDYTVNGAILDVAPSVLRAVGTADKWCLAVYLKGNRNQGLLGSCSIIYDVGLNSIRVIKLIVLLSLPALFKAIV